MNEEISFQTGPYGEILPPPLLTHVTPEDAWQRYYDFNLSIGITLDGPQNESEKLIWYNLAAVFCHQIRLREVIGGKAKHETAVEAALRFLVQQGALMSLRPIGMEHKHPKTFAPVLTRLTKDTWRIGLPEKGRAKVFKAGLETAVEQAQQIYVQWVSDEKKMEQDVSYKLLR